MKPHYKNGELTEKRFEFEMLQRDIDCSQPISTRNYDYLIITKSGEYKKVQVKGTATSWRKNDSYEVCLKASSRRKDGDANSRY